MRKQIASRMSESMRTAPQYTMMMEVDCFDLKAYLKEFAERRQPDIGAAPTFSDLFIMACTIALLKNPLINSSFMGDHILVKGSINIGLAVSLGEDGLVVPNIKNAQSLTLDEIVRQRSDLVERARAGRLLPEEYSGGTFTISNLGVSPVRFFTPIINPPESAILGVGSIADKVAPIEGGLSVRPVGALSLTADHRNIDGAAAEKFMKDLKDILEHPEVMKEREA
jgi:pyruvate dehydrogenase E2 component (dihydrolipoamide acetyltransferase)